MSNDKRNLEAFYDWWNEIEDEHNWGNMSQTDVAKLVWKYRDKEFPDLREKARGYDLFMGTLKALSNTTAEENKEIDALLDKVKENIALREAVRVLGAAVRRDARIAAYNLGVEGENFEKEIGEWVAPSVMSNPIAAAAVKGTQ
jgi:hypothetical protein